MVESLFSFSSVLLASWKEIETFQAFSPRKFQECGNIDAKKNKNVTEIEWIETKIKMNLQHLSQKNLSSALSVSVELNLCRQLVIELFCSMSRLRSRNVSSLAVIVSQHKHLVSFVRVPYKKGI